ncbi:MAG: cytochrome b/b6 domain-containing protein [Candidatus Rokubacteria bacterium]|nr:cytochrome b/b6 domain-containing protein [Candidatus Rokubacteria bacterium]
MSDMLPRFTLHRRVEHLAVMVLFTILAVTGFPQKFADADWARWTVDVLGGVERTRWLHRMSGILFAVFTIVHVTVALVIGLTGRSWSIVPIRKDFTDAVQTLRYYLGLADQPARFDRYDYRQKFEYWGMVLGGGVMTATGFILYLPVLAARFLPGELIPAAKVAHSNEGLLAFLVVITWHIYNAHLSPDVFPFDPSIFTGKISARRLHHEHPLEYERMVGAAEHKP